MNLESIFFTIIYCAQGQQTELRVNQQLDVLLPQIIQTSHETRTSNQILSIMRQFETRLLFHSKTSNFSMSRL